MKKGLITIIIVAVITLVIGVGVFLLLSPRNTSTRDSESLDSVTTTTTVSSISDSSGFDEDEEEESTEETDENSDEVVFIGGDEVPTVPDVTLGDSEVYSYTGSSDESNDTEESEDTNEASNNDNSDTSETTTGDLEKGPINVTVTNKDYRIWTVFWITNTAQTGYINYGTSMSNLERPIYDDRENDSTNLVERYSHHVTVTNDEDDITEDNPTFYFEIVSGGEVFDEYGYAYEYENVSLTSSPSTPNSISVTSNEVTSFDRNDYVVLAKMIDSDGDESTIISDVFNSTGGVELTVGIARNESLNAYFPYSTSNDISVKVYGPNGYTGFAQSVALSRLTEEILNIDVSQTGYEGGIFSSSTSGDHTFTERYPTADTTGEDAEEESLPQTGVEDEWAFTSIFGFVVFLLGTFCILLLIPWNYKKLWEKKVVSDMEERF